jgi:hypothetical protein
VIRAAEVSLDRVETLVRRALTLLKDCYETYVTASLQVRRLMNQAMFEAFFVGRDGVGEAKTTEAYRTLLRV